jgi:hypothetical protein
MTSSTNPLRRAATPLLAALLTAAAFAAITVTAAPAARADGREAGERAIDAHRGEGARAGRTARHRLGGGRVTAVVKDDDDRERYEVHVRRGGRAYEVDLSRGFRVLSVRRDDDGPNHDAGDDHGVRGPTHDAGDDHGRHGAGHP